jgi:putative transcriptional regulator
MKNDDFGEMLIQAMEEAVEHHEGRLSARVDRVEITARRATVTPPPRYTAARIRSLRTRLGLSQPVFAGMLNVSGSTVRAWEQGARAPEGPSLRLLEIAEQNPDALLSHVSNGNFAADEPERRRE